MNKDVLTSAQGKENKSSYMNQLNTVNQKCFEENQQHIEILCDSIDYSKMSFQDIDSDILSVKRSCDQVTTSISGKNITTDDDDNNDELLRKTNSSDHEQNRRHSDASLMTNFTDTKTLSEFNLNSTTTSRSSRMNTLSSSLSMIAMSSKQCLAGSLINKDTIDGKSKHGVRNFLRKIFRSSSNSSRHQGTTLIEPLNIDLIHGKGYPSISPLPITQGPIRLFVLRHGERLDRYYSSQWLRQAFDKDGNFCRFSPILPESIPFRASILDFDLDPPLTHKGLKDSYHTGTALKEKNLDIHYCYSSPSLRCIQTATKILEGLQLHNKIKIRIEPGLFECTAWYTTNETSNILIMPKFMTKKELLENKYPIDKNYHEQMTIGEISQLETELEFYQRSHAVATSILKMHENEFITQIQQGQISSQHHIHILFIAHAPTLETCTRKLCGGKFRPDTLRYVIRNVDFLTMTVIEKTDNNSDKWIFRRNSFYGEEF